MDLGIKHSLQCPWLIQGARWPVCLGHQIYQSDILCSQINLHHSPTANLSLNEWFVGRKGHTNPKIALVQEPHNHKGKVSNISKSINVFTKKNQNNIRACIITTSNIDTWLLGQFSNEDQVAIAFKTNQTIMVVCSTYMPYDSVDPPPPKLMRKHHLFLWTEGMGPDHWSWCKQPQYSMEKLKYKPQGRRITKLYCNNPTACTK